MTDCATGQRLPHDIDGRSFRSVSNSGSGEVDRRTVFRYAQNGADISATYAGGAIARGHLVGFMLPDGRLRFHEEWQWLTGDGSAGVSVIEEI